MIDTHCHLEQPNYDNDRDKVIEQCKRNLDAVISSCAYPKDFDLTVRLVKDYPNFVFATMSIHPKYIKYVSEQEKEDYVKIIKKNRERILAIGETGTDYWWIKENEWRDKQRKLFIEMINLANELNLPLVIHSRNARESTKALEDTITILERYDVNRVQMHMYNSRMQLQRVLKNGWMISINTLLLRSKGLNKIVRDSPLEQLMLETDAPWLAVGENGVIKRPNEKRNLPIAVKLVAQKIAQIKKLPLEQVDKATTENAKRFFNI